ncbi:MAG: response regulator [Saprospiraceae bacterium]|nr:response regulator [Saprospiraceae bacterium]
MIVGAGKSILKLFPDLEGSPFTDYFTIRRPRSAGKNFNSILEFTTQIFILKAINSKTDLQFRGEIIQLDDNKMLFIGSPWLTNPDDLKTHHLSLTDYALHDAVTDLLQVVKVKDIANADIKMLNDRLEESEGRYRELVEFGSDIIYKLDDKGCLTFVNDVGTKKMGYSKSEALGLHYSEFVFEDWVSTVDGNFIKMVQNNDQELYFEFPMKTKTGGQLWVGQHTQRITTGNDTYEIRAFAKDITERKLVELELESSELRLSNLISTLQAGVLVEDEKRRIVLTNPYFCELFNISAPPKALVGADCSNAAEESKLLFDNPKKFTDRIYEILKNRKIVLGDELHMVDGRILERDYTPIFSGDRYLGHLWQYRDLTEKVMVQKNLIKARKEAEAAREAEMQFLAHMSHEIRTPLNAITGMLHLLMETDLSNDQREFVEIQKSSTEILAGIINDVLDISKIESGKLELNLEKLDLNDLLKTVKNTFSHQLKGKSVSIGLKGLEENEYYLLGDKVLINQILFNIMGNAIKFTDKGSIDISANELNKTADSRTIKFKIKDTGIGISKDKQKLIFDRFKQADKQTSVRFGGTGLGLAITKKIIDFLGGEISVASTLGKGSEFSVTLDFKKTDEKITIKSDREIKVEQEELFSNMKFLVAEDNVMNTYYVRRILSKLNAEVDYVFNGLEALKNCSKKVYDLIFMDIRMPEMDGLTATKNIRTSGNLNKDTPILALTASAFASQIDKALDAGTNDFLSKPFTPPQLLTKMQEILGHSDVVDTKEKQDFKTLDETVLKELYGDDLEAAKDMFEIFLETNLPIFNDLEKHLIDNNWSTAREMTHKLKPSFSMIGLPKLTDQMATLENHCDNSNSEAYALYQSIKSDLDHALDSLFNLHGLKPISGE